jgi:hypothetical protein
MIQGAKEKGEPFQARALGLYLLGHHPRFP